MLNIRVRRLALVLALSQFACGREPPGDHQFASIAKLAEQDMTDIGVSEKALIVVISFSDFSCALCYEDFLLFVRMLEGQRIGNVRHRARVYVRQDGSDLASMQHHVHEWANNIGISVPAKLVPDSLLQGPFHSKGRVVLFNERWEVVKHDSFPLGGNRARALVESLISH